MGISRDYILIKSKFNLLDWMQSSRLQFVNHSIHCNHFAIS